MLNAYVFHGGNYGMGIAMSASYFIQFLMLMTHFMKKDSYFRISLKGFEVSQIAEMTKAASPTLVIRLATTLRDLAVNRINIYVALSTAAIVARRIQNDTNTVLYCFSIGMGNTILTMSGMFYGAYDRRGLTSLFKCAVKMAVIVSGTIGIITFLGAEWIAECFTHEQEVVEFSAFSIRCMAVALVLNNLSVLFQHYLQGINEHRLVNLLFINRFFIPVATAWIMGYYFGSRGIMASIAASEFIFITFIAFIVYFRTGSLKNFMFLPDNFGGKESDNIYSSITSSEDVQHESLRAEKFCLEHGINERDAKLMSLFVEETAGNIIAHGKTRLWHKLSMDYRLSLNEGKICMTLRDCCGYFDPSAFYEAHKDEAVGKLPGLKIIMRLADDVRYFNAFNSNSIMISIDSRKENRNEGN